MDYLRSKFLAMGIVRYTLIVRFLLKPMKNNLNYDFLSVSCPCRSNV